MEECNIILKKSYRLERYDEIIVFKVEYRYPEFLIPIVEYNLFGESASKKLSLIPCSNIKTKYYIPKIINESELYKYDPESDYFSDKCKVFTTENNTDFFYKDRKIEFN